MSKVKMKEMPKAISKQPSKSVKMGAGAGYDGLAGSKCMSKPKSKSLGADMDGDMSMSKGKRSMGSAKEDLIKHEKKEISERKKEDKDDRKMIEKAEKSKSLSAKHSKAHPGFGAVEKKIEKEGYSKKSAGAIAASVARKASPAAKKANPHLKNVPMAKKK